MVDFLKSYWNNASNLSQSTYTAGDGSASFSFNDTAFQTTVQKNYGNSAFLSPLPVRIVFSSLFMVEGFVTSSSVQFVKFTRNYVPTICKVTLSVRALYIGFAREKAYLTDALETAVSDMVETNKKDKLLETTMKNLLRNVYLRYAPNPYTSSAVSGFIFSPSFEADTDKYSNEVISDTLLPEPGLVSQGDAFSTFKAWWDTSRYQYNLVYGGLLYSGVTKSFKDEVEKNGVTWSFSSRLEINKNLNFSNPNEPTGGELLFSGDFSYKKRSGGDIDEQTIGNNANSKIWTSYGTASNNVDNWAIKKPVRTAESVSQYDKITFSIITDYTLNYTNSTGAATTTRQVRKDHTIIAGSSSDWNKIKQYTPIWDMWTRTGGQSTVVPGS